MYRRIVSLILIPFLLLTQAVTTGHSHAGNEPAGHGSRAHIHLHSPETDEQNQHRHSHGSHCHEHKNHSDSDHEKPASDQMESLFDHDSSAVYLNSTDLSTGSQSNIKMDMVLLFQWNETGTDRYLNKLKRSGLAWFVQDCAPPDPDSPLFIRHHAILI